MKACLTQLTNLQMGYSFRSRLEASKDGAVAVIQMKDLSDDNTVDCDDLMHIDMDNVKERHLAQKGDLVFRSRGLVNTTAILLEDPGHAVIAAPLIRIRVSKPRQILPEYLNWYISQVDAQAYLASRARGSAQKMISKQSLEQLEVVLPSLTTQQHIIELARLGVREQFLLRTLADRREQYISNLLMQVAKGA